MALEGLLSIADVREIVRELNWQQKTSRELNRLRADFFASRARYPADSNSHRADSDAKIGRRPDRTGDNPDDASADIKLNRQA